MSMIVWSRLRIRSVDVGCDEVLEFQRMYRIKKVIKILNHWRVVRVLIEYDFVSGMDGTESFHIGGVGGEGVPRRRRPPLQNFEDRFAPAWCWTTVQKVPGPRGLLIFNPTHTSSFNLQISESHFGYPLPSNLCALLLQLNAFLDVFLASQAINMNAPDR